MLGWLGLHKRFTQVPAWCPAAAAIERFVWNGACYEPVKTR